MNKSTTDQIRATFDSDVERFSNAQTGQTSTADGALAMSLFEQTIAAVCPQADTLCDIGCGGGNFSVRALGKFPHLDVTLVDLSPNMLARANERIAEIGGSIIESIEGDIRNIEFQPESFDIIVASAVLHHLRSRKEWMKVLTNVYNALKPNGMFWMWDLIKYENLEVQEMQTNRYAEYLRKLLGESEQKLIFARIQEQDTPESVPFILNVLTKVGFAEVDVIHKNMVFCALYARK